VIGGKQMKIRLDQFAPPTFIAQQDRVNAWAARHVVAYW